MVKAAAPAGTIGKGRRTPGARNGIRATGGVPRTPPRNNIRAAGRPMARRINNVRPYKPATADGQMSRIDRQIDRTMKEMVSEVRAMRKAAKKRRPEIERMDRQLQRMNAQAIAKRLSGRAIEREIAGAELGIMGGKAGAKAIQRRMQRAADAAARGSKPARRAREIYGNQLAFMGKGKPAAGRNNLRPGPRNTQGPPKKKRNRRRKPTG